MIRRHINRDNMEYIENLFEQYLKNPERVSPEWQTFFSGVELGRQIPSSHLSEKELMVYQLISAYREDGHLKARLDPLNRNPPPAHNVFLEQFDLQSVDPSNAFQVSSIIGLPAGEKLKNIVETLEQIYCGTISLQVGGCQPEVREWFFNEFERRRQSFQLSNEQKRDIFYDLARAEALERFLHSRFVGAKRFSIEGADVLIPMLSYLAEAPLLENQEADRNVQQKEIVIGMAHRGRLNVLCNFLNKAMEIVFTEFDGGRPLQRFDFDGDVKYHQGYSAVKKLKDGHVCNVLLAYNPSHLEAVNAVVCGVTRARQRAIGDRLRKAVLPILIHGDAAFCGQGSVSEALQLSSLAGYTTGGALHIILNNQVGFTTDPMDARSSVHASDLAKVIQAPVILVSADDILSCVRAVDIAWRFRQQFGTDVFIDLICYRRYGHSESDEPAFTQPLMAQKIKHHRRVRDIYSEQLIRENILTHQESQTFYEQHFNKLQSILDQTRGKKSDKTFSEQDLKGSLWAQCRPVKEEEFFKTVDTCPLDTDLQKALDALTHIPPDFNLHPKVEKLIKNRQKMIKDDCLDWALCELAAYGTLCLENHPVRVSGQDSIRGTFSHRHAMYFDTKTGRSYSPLATLNSSRGEFCIYNSPLSEMAVLGFEYGNACADHSFFTLWEAQFGDFSNGAQIIIDQFISSGEEKWMQSCALVLLLPHGYEGQGPEHSSARLERYLQLCAKGNMQVCYPTTPANFFHLLRRQMNRKFYKPLVVMTPKSLLRHPAVVSSRKQLIRGDGFQEVIGSEVKKTTDVEVLMICTGKIYFDLMVEKNKSPQDWKHIAIVRLEQLYPFPSGALTPWLNGYPRIKKILWVQEEPINMGAGSFVVPRLKYLIKQLGLDRLAFIRLSRKEKASPATGSLQNHVSEYEHLMKSVWFHAKK